MDTDKIFCSIVIDVLKAHGVETVVCSPGSRNAPLLIAASSRDELKKHIIADERSAAFFALGQSIVSRKPVALICTSGTALLNYAPAVAEAYYQGIPLIIISADRPLQWIDQDDSQTIRQFDALNNFIKKSYDLPSYGYNDSELQWYANRIANDAMNVSLTEKRGPVHINIRLSEPLNIKVADKPADQRIISVIKADTLGNKEELNLLAEKLSVSKILLVVGFMQPDSSLQKVISDFSCMDNVVVMAESISNLHLSDDAQSVDSVLSAYDNDILDDNVPDIVISLGGALVSRKLKEYLRRNRNKVEHWSLGYSHTTVDCFMSLSLRIETSAIRFLRYMTARIKRKKLADPIKEYKQSWLKMKESALKVKNSYIENAGWSELKAFDIVLKNIPRSYNLFLSNGTTVRYAQLIKYIMPHASYCNRGVSGIEGTFSTAIGGASAYKGDTVLITGDLSFSYEVGALGLKDCPESFKVILIDNCGGGIFRFISSTDTLEEREEYFCAPPVLPLKELCSGYGWTYMEAYTLEELETSLPIFLKEKKKCLLKISCSPDYSAEILKGYFEVKVRNY